eukprot:63225-Pyramimonas_sp.AAC.1
MIVRAPRRTAATASPQQTSHPTQTNTNDQRAGSHQYDDDNTDESDSTTSGRTPTALTTHDDDVTLESLEPW